MSFVTILGPGEELSYYLETNAFMIAPIPESLFKLPSITEVQFKLLPT